MFSSISDGYKQIWKSIIRPPRESYSDFELGPKEFVLESKHYQRTDFSIFSTQGFLIFCSHFEPIERERKSELLPCLIYLHGNCSSRIEALSLVPLLLPLGATVVCFDWAGCGKSEGKYISLGFFERFDLDNLIQYLRSDRRVGIIGLWGRSMGAVSALFSACNNLDIGSMVLDSPFSSMKKLAYELAKKNSSVPGFVLKLVYSMIRSTIQKKAGFDIDLLKPIEVADKCMQPALFITGKHDDFVKSHHTQKIYDRYCGDKDILYINGDHNSTRPPDCIERAAKFFYQTLFLSKAPKVGESRKKIKRNRSSSL